VDLEPIKDRAADLGLDIAGDGTQRVCGKILVLITEDWFALSHFQPLLRELRTLSDDVAVVTASSGRLADLRALGVRTIEFNMRRGSFNPIAQARVSRRLARLIEDEGPDAVHAISLQPMLLASLALAGARSRPRALLLHVTGLGYIGASRSAFAILLRAVIFALIRWSTRRTHLWLLAENPDDLAALTGRGIGSAAHSSIVPGAGVDPHAFPAQPVPEHATPRAAYVGRLIRSKGVEVLVQAFEILRARGVAFELALYGAPDLHNPDAVSADTLGRWSDTSGLSWHGHVSDVPSVWREADIAVVPTLGGEGVPRAMLEAAACARPLIVSDVPGCNHFVRQGVEGFIVPPADPEALAEALAKAARDPELRRRQGAAARARLLSGYTTAAVGRALRDAYRRLFSS
jgi:glycosyltransferase involved in cell wall biosynthesis